MIARRERLQYGCLFVTDLVSLVLSVGVSWLIMDGLFGKMVDFRQPYQFLEGFLMLFIAFILTFFVFDQSENIVTRDEMREAELAVGFNALLALFVHDDGYSRVAQKSFEPLQIYAGVSEPCRHRDDAGGCVGHHPGASEGLV